MEEFQTTAPLAPPSGATSSGGGSNHQKRRHNRNRNRNRNRNAKSKSKSRSPTRDDQEDGWTKSKSKSRSPSRRKDNLSRSPTRDAGGNKSRSPTRRPNSGGKSRSPACSGHHRHQQPQQQPHRHKKSMGPPSDMTVICNRCDLWDSAAHFQPDDTQPPHHPPPDVVVRPYHFAPDGPPPPLGEETETAVIPNAAAAGAATAAAAATDPNACSVVVARVPHQFEKKTMPAKLLAAATAAAADGTHYCDVIDTSIPNPHDPTVVHDKYWAQRRRLFSKFDQGVQLDGQGWYSVTPEIIADHVAQRIAELATTHIIPRDSSQGIVILDAFCGCGGNSIAFGKIPSHVISKVVCVDTDRSKLLKAAHNAALYGIPPDKLIFVECNSAFILSHCYKKGEFILDQPTATMPSYMPPPVMASTTSAGYTIGGLDILPRRIDAVFMDPPWGGVDYEVLGKNGYDLQKNMKILVGPPPPPPPPEEEYEADGDGCDDFFDSFAGPSHSKAKNNPKSQHNQLSQRARKAQFNNQHTPEQGKWIDGMELLRVAAAATSAHVVVYDLPRNTSKTGLGKCAVGAGYRGNLKLEEHYLNGRLKTVTAYMGADYSDLINRLHPPDHQDSGNTTSGDEAE